MVADSLKNGDIFDTDPRSKFGDVDWEADLDSFVDSLNRGTPVRPDGLAGVPDAPEGTELTADDLLRLKSLLAGYR